MQNHSLSSDASLFGLLGISSLTTEYLMVISNHDFNNGEAR